MVVVGAVVVLVGGAVVVVDAVVVVVGADVVVVVAGAIVVVVDVELVVTDSFAMSSVTDTAVRASTGGTDVEASIDCSTSGRGLDAPPESPPVVISEASEAPQETRKPDARSSTKSWSHVGGVWVAALGIPPCIDDHGRFLEHPLARSSSWSRSPRPRTARSSDSSCAAKTQL